MDPDYAHIDSAKRQPRGSGAIVVRCFESTKLANYRPTTVGGHDCLCILFNVHARLSNDFFITDGESVLIGQQNTHS